MENPPNAKSPKCFFLGKPLMKEHFIFALCLHYIYSFTCRFCFIPTHVRAVILPLPTVQCRKSCQNTAWEFSVHHKSILSRFHES